MKRDIRTTLAIDGEREFKKALTDAGREMSVLASESRAVTAAYATNKGSAEALTSKNKVLTKQVDQQEEIYRSLANAVKESTQKYGESSRQTDGYKIKLNNASTALDKMKTELKQNETALEQMAKAEKTAGKQADKMGKELKGAGKDAKSFKAKVKDFATSSAGQFASIAGAVALAKQALKALWDTISGAAEYADEMNTLSTQTGVTVDELQKFAYTSKFIDVETKTYTDSLKKLSKNMYEASIGTKQQKDAFDELGISYEDGNGNLRDNQEVFYEMIDTLGAMTDETKRDALAMVLMGKSATDLNPLIKAGSEVLKEYGQEADDMGVVLSSSTITSLQILQDELDKTNAIMDAKAKEMAATTAGATAAALEFWNDWTAAAEKANTLGINPENFTDATIQLQLQKAAMENLSITEEELKQKQLELTTMLINEGTPATEANTEALNLLAQGTDAAIHATEQMMEAQTQADAVVQTSFETYKTISAQYMAEVEKTTESILSGMGGLFESFDAGLAQSQEDLDAHSKSLLDSLESQVDGLEGWSESIEKLAKKGIDEGLLETLYDMGPEAYAEIEALNNMTEDQLERYQGLFETKGNLAKDAAVSALEPMAEDVAEALLEVEKTIAAEDAKFEQLGTQLGYGIGDGIDSSTWYIKSEARKAIEAAIEAAEKAADINSPSRKTHDRIGLNMGYGAGGGFIDGMEEMAPDMRKAVVGSMDSLSAAVSSIDNRGGNVRYIRDYQIKQPQAAQPVLQIGEFHNHSDDDIKSLAQKFEMYRRQAAAAYGG